MLLGGVLLSWIYETDYIIWVKAANLNVNEWDQELNGLKQD